MTKVKRAGRTIWVTVIWTALLLALNLNSIAMTPLTQIPQTDDEEREVSDTFFQARPKSKSQSNKKSAVYRRKSEKIAQKPVNSSKSLIGVNLWRLRKPMPQEVAERILEYGAEDGEPVEWVPERISSDTPLAIGDRVRLSIEMASSGYLYVIDREVYADGSYSDPYLIFPITRIRGGNNLVSAGRVIEIPDQQDRPSYFKIRQTKEGQLGDTISVLISPTPLTEISIGPRQLKLDKEMFAQWEARWGTQVEKFEIADNQQRTWTSSEKAAGGSAEQFLTEDDPGPQTLYRVAAKPGDPLLLKLQLQFVKR